MPELLRILDGLADPVTIFDMGSEVADARVEDIAHWVFPKEETADYPHAFRVFVVQP